MILKKWLLAAALSVTLVGVAQAYNPVPAGTLLVGSTNIGYNLLTNTDLAHGVEFHSQADTYDWVMMPSVDPPGGVWANFSGNSSTFSSLVNFNLQSATAGQGFGLVSVDYRATDAYIRQGSLFPTFTISVPQLGITKVIVRPTNTSWDVNFPSTAEWSFDGQGLTNLNVVMDWTVSGACYLGGSNCAYAHAPGFNVGAKLITAAVPEPETFSMMLMGLGLMGFVARRRKNRPC
jgi:hypothetical protein